MQGGVFEVAYDEVYCARKEDYWARQRKTSFLLWREKKRIFEPKRKGKGGAFSAIRKDGKAQ
jgi:hypothetical protein